MTTATTSSVQAARQAEADLAAQLNATAEALASLGRSQIDQAIDRVKAEAEALKARLASARSALTATLENVLAGFAAFSAELVAGMELPAVAPIAPALPAIGYTTGEEHEVEPAVAPAATSPVLTTERVEIQTAGQVLAAAVVPDADKASYDQFASWIETPASKEPASSHHLPLVAELLAVVAEVEQEEHQSQTTAANAPSSDTPAPALRSLPEVATPPSSGEAAQPKGRTRRPRKSS